jgi:hypothetical protein
MLFLKIKYKKYKEYKKYEVEQLNAALVSLLINIAAQPLQRLMTNDRWPMTPKVKTEGGICSLQAGVPILPALAFSSH